MYTANKHKIFPIVRLLSSPVSRCLFRLPVSANLITTASLIAGLASCYLVSIGNYRTVLFGSFFLILCYILDNADGEVARAKNQCTDFGEKFDTFVDWLVHAVFFLALGWGASKTAGNQIWLWFGFFATLGGTINYIIGIVQKTKTHNIQSANPENPVDITSWFAFIFRELFRADFCFIVFALAISGAIQYLLPLAAVGAQIYWITRFIKGASRFHV